MDERANLTPGAVPVWTGSRRLLSLEFPGFAITKSSFAGNVVLAPHLHERPIIAVMLHGGFRTNIARRSLDCRAGISWTEPLGEQHSNVAGPAGAHVLIIESAGRDELWSPFEALISEVHRLEDPHIASISTQLQWLVTAEVPDRLEIEGSILRILAASSRRTFYDADAGRAPGWLMRTRERLHDEWRDAPSLQSLSSSAGVHACYLAHSFKRHFGMTVGEYVRLLRISWALRELAYTSRSLTNIALAAGYSDQPHFTRACRDHMDVTPAQYRRRTQSLRCDGESTEDPETD
jgi:AraC family transcriptional regulator